MTTFADLAPHLWGHILRLVRDEEDGGKIYAWTSLRSTCRALRVAADDGTRAITELELPRTQLSNALLETVSRHFPRLRTLKLTPSFARVYSAGNDAVSDADLQRFLGTVPDLTSLDLSGIRGVTADGVARVVAPDRLVSLNLDSTHLFSDSAGVAEAQTLASALRGLTALEELRMKCTMRSGGVSTPVLESIGTLGRLTALDLSWCEDITDEGVAHLGQLQGLRSLRLRFCEYLTVAALVPIGNLLRLTELDLRDCREIALVAEESPLAGLARLRALDLRSLEVSRDFLRATVSRLPDLASLVVSDLSDRDVLALSGLPHLASLEIRVTPETVFTDVGVRHIAETFPGLTSLGIVGAVGITPTAVKYLADCLSLTSLNLKGCWRITDATVAHVCDRLGGLTSLNLGDCFQLSHAAVRRVARGLPGLTSLSIRSCRATPASICDAVSRLRGLRKLALGGCNVTDDVLAAAASHLGALESLGVESCGAVTDAGVEHVSRIARLLVVKLSGCDRVTLAGVRHLARLPRLQRVTVADALVENAQRALPSVSVWTM